MNAAPPPAPAPAAAAPRRPRRWRRRVLLGLGLGLLLLLLAPLALALGPVRDWVAGRIGERLGRRVEIGSAFAFWGRGVDLEEVVVHSPAGFDGPLARVRRVHVDLDVLDLIGGQVRAAVRVVDPHLTFRRLSDGRGNADGVLERLRGPAEPEPAEPARPAEVELVLLGGRVEAPEGGPTPAGTLDQIQARASVGAAGLTLDAALVALGLREGGGDATLRATLVRPRAGAGRFELSGDPLDLSRAAPLARAAAGIEQLAGHLEFAAQGRLDPEGLPSGRLKATARGLTAHLADGTVVSLAHLAASAESEPGAGGEGLAGRVQVTGSGLVVTPPAGAGRRAIAEPDLALRGGFALTGPAGRWRLALREGHLGVGRLVQVTLSEEVTLALGEAPEALGTALLEADLGRLGALGDWVPALAALEAGALRLEIQGRPPQADRVHVALAARVEGLALEPGDLAAHGHREARLEASAVLRESPAAGWRLLLHRLRGAGISTGETLWTRPLVLGLRAGEWRVEGPVELTADLAAMSPLLAGALGLAPGERLGGTLTLAGQATHAGPRGTAELDLTGRGVSVPPSLLDPPLSPQDLTGRLVVERSRDEWNLRLGPLGGLGIRTASATARLARAGAGAGPGTPTQDPWRLADATLTARVDLAGARAWLGPLLGLAAAARLAGEFEVQRAQVVQEPGRADRRLVAQAEVKHLRYQPGPTARALEEPLVRLGVDATLAEAGGRHRFAALALDSQALSLKAPGASLRPGPDPEVEVDATVSGDAARLAPLVAALLGAGYEDLVGRGPIEGQVRLHGGLGANLTALRVDGRLGLGAWRGAGVDLDAVRLTALRPRVEDPLDLALAATLAGGRARADLTLLPRPDALPFRLGLDLEGVDTSGWVVSRGAGSYLKWLLPALLPAEAEVPVLSGRLTAKVALAAEDLGGERLRRTLAGRGTLAMREGEVKGSTLLAGGRMGQLATVLRGLAPEAADVVEGVGKSLAFRTLESRFSVGGEQVTIEALALTGRYLVVDMRGTVGLDERLALEADLTLEGRAGERVARLIPDRRIPLAIDGTLAAPRTTPRLDLEALLANPLLEDLKDLGGRKAKDLLEDLFGKRR